MRMFARLKRQLAAGLIVLLHLGAAPALAQDSPYGIQPDGRLVVSPAVATVIGEYLERVHRRFGALAVSRTGDSAGYYICQSRLWKNCDDYSLEDSFISIPSGKLAAKLAQDQCRRLSGTDCIVLFINERWQRPFTLSK
jgi:hypothetical protein